MMVKCFNDEQVTASALIHLVSNFKRAPSNKSVNDLSVFFSFCICMYVCRFQNVVLGCQTPRLHCFLSFHWPLFMFLSFMAFLIPSIQFFFGLPRALFCFGIHFNSVLGDLHSAIL